VDSINWIALFSGIAGGLGLFLYGMKLMSEGLQKVAGDKLRTFLEKLTANRVVGTMTGAGVTAVLQSSSATTVMVVGFVNAGLMDLIQALSVVLGANLGTTITAQLIAFKVGQLAYPAIGCGVFMRLFLKDKKVQYYGEVLLGFGILFAGLAIMKGTFVPLKDSPGFTEAFIYFKDHRLLAVLAGAILTVIVQSSSATIGITMTLAATGVLDLYTACAFVLGENIGTTITANLAAIGTNVTARRAAFGHFLINLLGVCYMLFFLEYFIIGVEYISDIWYVFFPSDVVVSSVERNIANVHTGFNLINMIVFLPILHILAKICEKIIKGVDEKQYRPLFLDDRLIDTPSFAVSQAMKEVERMAGVAIDMLKQTKEGLFQRDRKVLAKVYEMEHTVDLLERDISRFLVKIYQKPITVATSKEINHMMQVLHDLEKIGDYAENITKYSEKIIAGNVSFSRSAMAELSEMFDVAIRFTQNVTASYCEGGFPKQIDTEDENVIDRMRKTSREKHLSRLHDGNCTVENGIMFIDILNNLEKTGDQSFNIAQIIMGKQ